MHRYSRDREIGAMIDIVLYIYVDSDMCWINSLLLDKFSRDRDMCYTHSILYILWERNIHG